MERAANSPYAPLMRVLLVLAVLVLADLAWSFWTLRRIEAAHPPTGLFAQTEAGRIHVRRRDPAGAPRADVVLLHGASGNGADVMEALGGRLAGRGFRVWAPDRPGHGWSERGANMASPAAQARALRAALEGMGVRSAIVLGHSWSGALAEHFVLDHADWAEGAVLLSPVTHPWPGGIAWHYGAASLPTLGVGFAALVALPVGSVVLDAGIRGVFAPQTPPPDYAARTGAALVLRPSEFVANALDVAGLKAFVTAQAPREGEIARPVAIVAGDADAIVTTSIHSVVSAKAVPGATLRLLPGIGHAPHWAAPDAVLGAVEDVFARAQNARDTRPETPSNAPGTSSQ